MNKVIYIILTLGFFLGTYQVGQAGNPDRQGEAGAYELLMNPWARSAGLHTMSTSMVGGVESMRLNVAGLSRITGTEVLLSHARYLEGTDLRMNGFGFARKMGENGSFGLSLMALDFGDIPITTTAQPGGTGGTFSPNFFNIGIGYAHEFENKISVGFLMRGISESTADLKAFGFALDAGVQYVSGEQDQFKLGLSLRNVGTRMSFGGQGLAEQLNNPDLGEYQITFQQRISDFELPSVLNIGISYDILFAEKNRLTLLGNFTSNSFSRDQIGGGFEYAFKEMFMIRAGYKHDFGAGTIDANVYTGLAGGISFEVPLKKEASNSFGVDYAYRHTNPWSGTHNITVRLGL